MKQLIHSKLARPQVAVNNISGHTTAAPDWDRVPPWLQDELRIVAAILRHPNVYADVEGDLRPEHFFMPENQAIAEVLEEETHKQHRLPTLNEIGKKLSHMAWLRPDNVSTHMALLRTAPPICECHLVNTILWFTNERRFFRGISEAAEAIAEQDQGWTAAMGYLFRAIDLPRLKDAGWLARVQAAVLAAPTLSHGTNHVPEAWREALQSAAGADDGAGLKVLSELVQAYARFRAMEGMPSVTKDAPEFTGLTPADARTAIARLSGAGLISVTPMVSEDKSREILLLRPTAKALIPLLKEETRAE